MNTYYFVHLQRLSSTFLSIFLYAHIFALNATNSVMIFRRSSSFIMPIIFLSFAMASSCYLPLNIHSYQTYFPHPLPCPSKNPLFLSHTQNCLQGADAEILKRGGALCRRPWLLSEGLKRPK